MFVKKTKCGITPVDSFTNAMIIKKEQCGECGKRAAYMNLLKMHMRAIHGVLMQFSCISDCSSARTDV